MHYMKHHYKSFPSHLFHQPQHQHQHQDHQQQQHQQHHQQHHQQQQQQQQQQHTTIAASALCLASQLEALNICGLDVAAVCPAMKDPLVASNIVLNRTARSVLVRNIRGNNNNNNSPSSPSSFGRSSAATLNSDGKDEIYELEKIYNLEINRPLKKAKEVRTSITCVLTYTTLHLFFVFRVLHFVSSIVSIRPMNGRKWPKKLPVCT